MSFEKGYTPWNKGKKCSQLGWSRGLTKETNETVKRISEMNKGRIPWNKGKKSLKVGFWKGKQRSEATKKKISFKLSGRVGPNKGKIFSESWIRNIIKGSQTKPNKAELKLDGILQSLFPNEYGLNVLGDKLILGGKIPDFVNMNGQKKVLELFGRGFHKPSSFNNYKVPYKRTAKGRKAIFKRLGYGCLVIWSKELKNPVRLSEKLINFNRK